MTIGTWQQHLSSFPLVTIHNDKTSITSRNSMTCGSECLFETLRFLSSAAQISLLFKQSINPSAHLGSSCGSVAVQFCIGLDVVGVNHQCFSVQLVSCFIVVVLESLVALLLLGFQGFCILVF